MHTHARYQPRGPRARLGSQVSARILGRRTAPFHHSLFLTASRMVLPKILVLTTASNLHLAHHIPALVAVALLRAQAGAGGTLAHASASECVLSLPNAQRSDYQKRLFTRNNLRETLPCNLKLAQAAFWHGVILVRKKEACLNTISTTCNIPGTK